MTVREPEPESPETSPLVEERARRLGVIEARFEAEIRAAEALVRTAGSAPAIREALAGNPAEATLGLVRVLIDRSEVERGETPIAALETIELALEVARLLEPSPEARGMRVHLEGLAEKERANVLRVLGRVPEATDALTRAEALLRQGAAPDWDLAGCLLVRGTLEMHGENYSRALEAYASAEQTFLAYGDDKRVAYARMMAAAVYAEMGNADRAAEMLRGLSGDPGIDDETRSQVLFNLGNCELDRRRFAEAQTAWEEAANISSALHGAVAASRMRWQAGSLLVLRGELTKGHVALQEAKRGFLEAGIPRIAASVSLEIVEVLMAEGRYASAREPLPRSPEGVLRPRTSVERSRRDRLPQRVRASRSPGASRGSARSAIPREARRRACLLFAPLPR